MGLIGAAFKLASVLAGGAVLRGVVRAPGGRLVEDARGTLLDAGGGVVDSVTTASDGVFASSTWPPGPTP